MKTHCLLVNQSSSLAQRTEEMKSPSANNPSFFINLPIPNEAENTEMLPDGIRRELHILDYTICVIDDGSKDGTLDLVKKAMAESDSRIHLICREKKVRGCQRGAALLVGCFEVYSIPTFYFH